MMASGIISRANTFVPLLDLRINKLGDEDVACLTKELIHAGQRCVIANQNLHSVYLWYHEPRMRDFYSAADYIHVDGMSLIWIGNMLGLPLRRRDRAAALDFFPLLAELAVTHGWRIFYLGSKPGVAEKAAAELREEYKDLQIQTHHGHFDVSGDENRKVVAEINAYAPHILFVGMGMPRQEIWILENQKQLRTNVIFPAGALMDYRAGEIPTPPRWLASFYLEWLYRLISEPARLSRRYLLEPWFVLGQVLKHQVRFRGRNMTAQDGRYE
jgi:N-acetylglucosaminyldiphosphoundecaprenol N-acetyl-beta-D-mannosaminyltransferase